VQHPQAEHLAMALADGFRVQYEGMGVVKDADNLYAVAVEMLTPPQLRMC
jgi:hypothetical protein